MTTEYCVLNHRSNILAFLLPFGIAGILEKLTVLLIDHPHNMNVVLTVPKWQFYVMPFLAHGSLSLMPSLAEHAGASVL